MRSVHLISAVTLGVLVLVGCKEAQNGGLPPGGDSDPIPTGGGGTCEVGFYDPTWPGPSWGGDWGSDSLLPFTTFNFSCEGDGQDLADCGWAGDPENGGGYRPSCNWTEHFEVDDLTFYGQGSVPSILNFTDPAGSQLTPTKSTFNPVFDGVMSAWNISGSRLVVSWSWASEIGASSPSLLDTRSQIFSPGDHQMSGTASVLAEVSAFVPVGGDFVTKDTHVFKRAWTRDSTSDEMIVVVLNWSATGAGGISYDLPTVMTHETGHSVGLFHHGDPGSIMFDLVEEGLTTGVITNLDEDAVRFIYP